MTSVGEYLFYQTPAPVPRVTAKPSAQGVAAAKMAKRRVLVRDIVVAVSKVTGVTTDAIESDRKFEEYSRARWAIMLLATELTDASLSDIARVLGGKNHSTVHHGLKSAAKLVEDGDAAFLHVLKRARARLPRA